MASWLSLSLAEFLVFLLVPSFCWFAWKAIQRSTKYPELSYQSFNDLGADDEYYSITPLPEFRWNLVEPLKVRPFKPLFHLTMALQKCPMSDLIAIDNTYLDRVGLRRKLIAEQGDAVLAANPIIDSAVKELYVWLFGTYLPGRFPTMFKIPPRPRGKATSHLHNLVTREFVAVEPPEKTEDALRTIGSHLDVDFLFLLPSANPADEGRYGLEGYVACFPSGFDWRKKINRRLSEIHGPVPGYAARLEKSMDRFFASMPAAKAVKRENWSIQTSGNLFNLTGSHLYDGDEVKAEDVEKINLERCLLRCERQTLHRLPESGAIVFAFKTYTYPIRQIKEEGNGEALARAIEGLKGGSVPKMNFYKRGVVWGKVITAYLRN